MADQLYKGFYTALQTGLLDGTPDIRLHLVMAGFTCDEDTVYWEDITDLDEFDGVGYAAATAASVTAAYVDGSDEWQLDFEDLSFGDPVAPGSGNITGMVVRLYVDGTDANDIILAFTDSGGFGVNAANGSLSLVLPATGLLYVKQAA